MLQAVNEQKEQLERHVAVLDKAVAQGKFEIASDVMHDIGNAVVGFGSYLPASGVCRKRISRRTCRYLAGFFEEQKTALRAVIGEDQSRCGG